MIKWIIFSAGSWIIGISRYIVALFSLYIEALEPLFNALFRRNKKGGLIGVAVYQTLLTGVQAFTLVSVIALVVGVLVIVQFHTLMPKVGASDFFGKIMVLGVFRELGPIVTAVIIIGRSGSALATYIGNMKINDEIDALEVMGINPVHYSVMPAILGAVISMVCLTFYFDAIAILGGFFISQVFVDMYFGIFIEKIIAELTFMDLFITVAKSVSFGSIIAVVSCYHAFGIGHSVNEVPKATISSVVNSIILVILMDGLLTGLFYANLFIR
ncbi:MAG: ABC transporter permease [Fibrobacterota bacterium]